MEGTCGIRLATVAVALLTVGCRSEEPALTPTPSPVPAPAPTVSLTTLSGTVYEHTFDGQVPLSGAHVLLLGHPPSVWGTAWREFETDNDGRFMALSLPAPSFLNVRLGSAHVLPCAGGLFWIDPPAASIELHATSRAGGVPPSHPKAGIFGMVYERVASGIIPVADATLDLLGAEDQHLGSVSETDSHGRFGFCKVDEPLSLSVSRKGYVRRWGVEIPRQGTSPIDVEIVREGATTFPSRLVIGPPRIARGGFNFD